MPSVGLPPGTLVDSNVLLDVFTEDPRWAGWSEAQLAEAFDRGPTVINPIIYAEISIRFASIEELEHALPVELEREALPWEAGFLAGKCFVEYRRRRGERRSPRPDLYIGAHAAVTGRSLLTRDPARYRSLLPRLELISP
jgi:predicted nucleic acid-binding protein